VKVLTESHDTSGGPGVLGPVVARGVTVDSGAWIGSFSVLIGCHIGEGAVVAAGTVVRCQDVAPGVMVAGNPARVVARWDGEAWVLEDPDETQFNRRLE
jgi:maltose O-acetyltransferase